jgi:hypothetical protein
MKSVHDVGEKYHCPIRKCSWSTARLDKLKPHMRTNHPNLKLPLSSTLELKEEDEREENILGPPASNLRSSKRAKSKLASDSETSSSMSQRDRQQFEKAMRNMQRAEIRLKEENAKLRDQKARLQEQNTRLQDENLRLANREKQLVDMVSRLIP